MNTDIYIAQPGQSIFDVCIQTYGTLDKLYTLLQDNGIPSIVYPEVVGKTFLYDKSQNKKSSTFSRNKTDGIIYATLYNPPRSITSTNRELREDGGYELEEDGGIELRE